MFGLTNKCDLAMLCKGLYSGFAKLFLREFCDTVVARSGGHSRFKDCLLGVCCRLLQPEAVSPDFSRHSSFFLTLGFALVLETAVSCFRNQGRLIFL